jgi:hypothetical protein
MDFDSKMLIEKIMMGSRGKTNFREWSFFAFRYETTTDLWSWESQILVLDRNEHYKLEWPRPRND